MRVTAGSSSRNDSQLLQDYVIIILIVWNVLLTLLVLALYVRKCCSACRHRRNQNRVLQAAEPEWGESSPPPHYQLDSADNQLVTQQRQHKRRQRGRVKRQ